MDEQGTIYAVAVVLEADSREEAFDRISDEVAPEPANAHFVGEPFEIERADEYDSRGVAEGILSGVKRELAQQSLTEQALNPEPAYTVVGTYGEGGGPYTVTVYTHNGPEAALTLAHEAYAERVSAHTGEQDPPELQVVAIFADQPRLIDFDREETWPKA